MKKNKIVIAIIGVVLIIIGLVFMLIGSGSNGGKESQPTSTNTSNSENNNENGNETEDDDGEIVFSGKYLSSSKELLLYQVNDYELYFVIDNVKGRARVINNEAEGTKNGITYLFVVRGKKITLKISDQEESIVFERISDLTFEEFYNTTYGNIEIFNSTYNGAYENDDMRITIYQADENEVYAFINNLHGKKAFISFKIVDEKILTGTYNGTTYTIVLSADYGGDMIFKENETSIQLPFMGEIIKEDAFALFEEYL